MSNNQDIPDDDGDEDFEDNGIEPELLYFRLTNGEDIVTLAVMMDEISDDEFSEPPYYMIEGPMKMNYSKRKNGIRTILTPWVHTEIVEDQQFKIYTHDILIQGVASQALNQGYFAAYNAYYTKKEKKANEGPSVPSVEEQLKTMDRLELGLKDNKRVKAFVEAELKKLSKKS